MSDRRVSQRFVIPPAFVRMLAVVAVMASLPLVMPSPAAATAGVAPADATDLTATMTVDSTGDAPDAALGDSVCATAAGTCTLRAAIEQANYNQGPNRIEFSIAGAGPHRIRPATALPALADPSGGTTIDGYTQPGSAPNTADRGSNADLRVELYGVNTIVAGIRIVTAENELRGLVINGFAHNIEIFYEEADGNRIVGNFIGPTPAGTQRWGSTYGIMMSYGPDQNVIGTPDPADRNVISGNGYKGIQIEHGNTTATIIQNNIIGLSADESEGLLQRDGIDLQWHTTLNMVGGFNPGEGNVLSGNQRDREEWEGGIDLSHSISGNLVVGNYFGTLSDGATVTAYSANTHGITIKDNPNNNYIAGNVIANSLYDGIISRHNYNHDNVIADNLIGVGVNGAPIGNSRNGITVNGHDNVLVDNVVGNSGGVGIAVVDRWDAGPHTNYPPAETIGNPILQTNFRGQDLPIDIGEDGPDANDPGDADTGPHGRLNHPDVDGTGPGVVAGTACAACRVQVMIDGPEAPDAVDWLGTVTAGPDGRWALADNALTAGRRVATLAVDPAGSTSEVSPLATVAAAPEGTVADGTAGPGQPSEAAVDAPPPPPQPEPYVPRRLVTVKGVVSTTSNAPVGGVGVELFTTSADGGRGSWVHSTITGADGAYTLYPAEAGCWAVTFVAPAGQVFTNRSPWLSRTVCTDDSTARLDARILDQADQSTISGVVSADGAGREGVAVDLFSTDAAGQRDQWTTSARTDTDGAYSFEVGPGCWALTFIAPADQPFADGSRYLNRFTCVTAGSSATVEPVALLVGELGTITGSINLDGQPAPGIQVDLFTAAADGSRAGWIQSAVTGDDGTYRFDRSDGCYVEVLIAPDGLVFANNGSRWLQRRTCLTGAETVTQPAATLQAG